jgi:patatin-like phospholipase/acyl hydrolase
MVMGLSAAEMLSFYTERGRVVFPLTNLRASLLYGLRSIVSPKFPQEALKAELTRAFAGAPNRLLGESICRLVIPACHARTGGAHVFRTNHLRDRTEDMKCSAVDVALATAAAPTYFRAAEVQGSLYVDRGVWANPKHASWLNMVEIEIGVLRTQCLDRRIDSKERLVAEIDAWEHQRNTSRARIKWMFTTEKARTKMERTYPKLSVKESESL